MDKKTKFNANANENMMSDEELLGVSGGLYNGRKYIYIFNCSNPACGKRSTYGEPNDVCQFCGGTAGSGHGDYFD